jgi:hypothetical protein
MGRHAFLGVIYLMFRHEVQRSYEIHVAPVNISNQLAELRGAKQTNQPRSWSSALRPLRREPLTSLTPGSTRGVRGRQLMVAEV